MRYIVQDKRNGKVYYNFGNRTDAENSVLHLEDMYHINYNNLEIVEKDK